MSDLVPHLGELAERINAEHQQAETALRGGLAHARNTGELLHQAKGQCRHGEWLPWLKANVRFSERTAQAYMRIAKRWPEVEAKAQGLADLTYEDSLKLLAALKEESPHEDLIVLPEDSLEVALRLADYFQAEAKAILEGTIVTTRNDIETILKSTIISIHARMSFLDNLIEQATDEEWKAPFAEMVKTIEAMDKLQKSLAEKHITCEYRIGELLRSMKDQLAALPEAKREKELADLPKDLREILQK